LLHKVKSLSIIDIAEQLRLSHPAVVQFADQMQSQKLVLAKKDKKDARKRILVLSAKGIETFEKLQPLLVQIEKATHELVLSTGIDVLYAIDKMEKLLETKSMYERVKAGLKNSLQADLKIVSFQPGYKLDFKRLNEEWLNEYFEIEKEDIKVLGNPEKYILQNGGTIFFALSNKRVVGTVAVTHHKNNKYELNKMAVTKSFQGNSIGGLLMKNAINFAKKKKAKQLYLETNRNLHAAIHLYEKFGFKMEAPPKDSKYKRSNLKMSLSF
jgi:ribosomal protein S18 acetylase RimI-like enzyme